jgi:hypothetical protein
VPDDNTNLEEVSDWLTKIIVDVGLVELMQIPGRVKKLSQFFIDQRGKEWCGGLFVMTGSFFFIIGFISSYVLGQVYLKLAIALANRILESPAKASADRAQALALLNDAPFSISRNRDSIPTLKRGCAAWTRCCGRSRIIRWLWW